MFDAIVLTIVALPLAAAVVNGVSLFAGDRLHWRTVQRLTCGAAGASFFLTLWVAAQAFTDPVPREVLAWHWLRVGEVKVDIAFMIDSLAAVMMLVVTGFSWLIALFSRNYMHKDRSFTRYFAALALFVFAMLVLVMGGNFVMLFLGWEAVGLCSYLLIGHYYERTSAARAGTRAFLMNRVGDAGFLIGICAIAQAFGSLDYRVVLPLAHTLDTGTATFIALSLLLGAVGKSAQLPLGTWLARAMEGPTPSSALIHAATMVTAGVYLIVRAHSIFDAAPDALLVVALIGLATALYGTLVGQTLSDSKGLLAFSTTTQLGLMFVACGLGAYTVAMFHLVAHAFLKCYLFLSAPSILHHLHGKASPSETEAAESPGSGRRLVPALVIGLLAGALVWGAWGPFGTSQAGGDLLASSLSGAVLLAAGALSLLVTMQHLGSLSRRTFSHGVGTGTGTGTGTGAGTGTDDGHAPHGTGYAPAMGLALLVALGAAAGLLPGSSDSGWFGQLLAPAIGASEVREANLWLVAAVAGAAALALIWSWLSATRLERFAPELPGLALVRLRGLYTAAMHRFWIEEFYEWALVAPVRRLGAALARFDERVLDRLVGSSAAAPRVRSAERQWEERMLGARAARGQSGASQAGVLAWLEAVSRDTQQAPQAPEVPRGAVGRLTHVAAADADWVERRVIGLGSGLAGRLTALASTLAAWAERWLFGRGVNDGLPQAGRFAGHAFERIEINLSRTAAVVVLIAIAVGGAFFVGA